MKKNNLLQLTLLALLLFLAQSAQSALYNIDFKSGWPGLPAYVGKGILGAVADNTWNGIQNPTSTKTNVAILDARGASSSVTLSSNGFGGDFYLNFTYAWGNFADYWYLSNSQTGTISFNTIPAGQSYDLILYCFSGSDGEITHAAVNGGTQQVTSGVKTGVIQWTENPDSKANLLRFTGTVPGDGIISIALSGASGNIQGLQLQVGTSSAPAQGTRTYKMIPDLAAGYDLKVMSIGTSLTDQPYGMSWPSQLYSVLCPKYQGREILSNRAISGSNSRSGVANIEAWLATDNPDVVFIEYAINDAVAHDNITVVEMKSNLDFICAKIKANNPNADIILQTMNNPVGAALTDRPNLKLYYQGYRDYASLNGYMLVDNYPLWKNLYDSDPTLWATYVPDNIHPSDEGRAAVMLDNLVATLETALTPDAEAPSVPAGLASGAITSSTIVLNWTASTDNVGVTGYDVYNGATLVGSSAGTTYTVTGLTAATLYNFQVRAKDLSLNYSAKCTAVGVTTADADVTAPSIPANLTQGTLTSNSVVLNWSASTDAVGVTGYDVYQGVTLLGSTATTSYTATALTASTGYSFTVKAKDAANNISDASDALSVTTNAAVVSSTYRYLKLTVNAHTLSYGPIFGEIEWMDGATAYPVNNLSFSNTGGSTAVSATIDDAALWKAFDGTYDENWSWGVPDDFTAFPYAVTVDLGAGNEIYPTALNLFMASFSGRGIKSYDCDGSNDNSNWTNLLTVTNTPTVANANTITIPAAVISAVAPVSQLSIASYPNPVLDQLNLNFGSQVKKGDVTILDVQGRSLMTQSVANTQVETLNVSSLSNGVYFVKVTADGKVMNSKFVKQ